MGKLTDTSNEGHTLSLAIKYAVYLDDEGNCIAIEDVANIDRGIVPTTIEAADPSPGTETSVFDIMVLARPSVAADYRIYRTCCRGGVCFRC